MKFYKAVQKLLVGDTQAGTDRHTEKQTDTQRNRQTHRETDRQTGDLISLLSCFESRLIN
jgi:hypothetical protein